MIRWLEEQSQLSRKCKHPNLPSRLLVFVMPHNSTVQQLSNNGQYICMDVVLQFEAIDLKWPTKCPKRHYVFSFKSLCAVMQSAWMLFFSSRQLTWSEQPNVRRRTMSLASDLSPRSCIQHWCLVFLEKPFDIHSETWRILKIET